ncbi:hypothetical protein [Natrinema salifodinae]|uniref:Small CPxCG-related zinc finger protein n=1 Tax=Natrinema salifodinae TaxID=1202768 RepID=A0A1I0PMH7_9EURY|nr:hypothetical protein [Natrinema salifodinae]SEW15627.1 hypothetical protein SAMN05216285_2734 [Natrinema salifodinae]
MSDNRERRDGESTAQPACPACGRPVTIVTVVGPTEGVAAPCGCRVPPGALADSDCE